MYERLPDSLKAEVFVKSKVIEDEDVLKERQEMVRAMSPTQLSEFHSIKDVPVPKFVENMMHKKIE